MQTDNPLLPAGSGAFVMGTGIVSVGLAVNGAETLSRLLFVVALAGWLVSGAAACHGAFRGGRHVLSLTGVAGTAVLGARFALLGWDRTADVVLAIAALMWLVLLPRALRIERLVPGGAFLVVVASESVAVLAALLSRSEHAAWLGHAALLPLIAGLAAYPLVAARFDRSELAAGFGDQWVAGGALAIAALACATAARTAGALRPELEAAALVTWLLAAGWLPLLLAAELRPPRRGYHVRRWATVFPVGMYAVCSFLVGSVDHIGAIGDFARVWVWVALTVWLVAFAALVQRGVMLASHYHPQR